MFGGPGLLLVPDLPDDAVDAVRGLLDGPAGDPVVAVVAGALRKGNALLALADASPAIWHLPSYEPGPREGVMLVGEIAGAAGLRPSQAAARLLFDQAGGDRGVIRQEIAKLALFLDAEPSGRTAFDMAELAAIGSGGTDAGYDQLVAAILMRDGRTAATQLAALETQNEAGIGALRALQRALWRLIDLRAVVDNGASPRAAVEGARPPVFWKEKDLVAEQLGRWTTPELVQAADALLGAERAIKRPGSLGESEASAAMLALARR
jgi:DNA polymerase-3 subunit delta